jgi:peptidoglycan/LPS O-acetylase OafA/YrhL/lysophospholipase L1-like esterase
MNKTAPTLSPPAAATTTRPRKLSMSYLPGVDGLRAISVIAVLLYHGRDAELGWLPEGGFLGVEVFFVISGYLITALLLAEFRNSANSSVGVGRIDLKRFWMRRGRRLLPALYLLLVTVSIYWFVFLHDELYRLRSDVLAAVTYVTNWYLIFSQQSYFEQAGRPSPFRHLWSLAVEEQFYLLWPVLLFGLLVLCRGRTGRAVAAILAAALASAVLMAVLYQEGTDPSRVYYGTDTRASGLLVGAALAFLIPPWRLSNRTGNHARWVIDGIGVLSLAGLLWFFLNTNEFDPFLYQGGFLLLSVVTAVAIAVAAHPASFLGGKVLGFSLLTWIGLRSYGIYLWHWPVYMVTRPDLDLPITGYLLLILRFALTFLLAELSFRLVEMPIRRGVIGRWYRRFRASRGEVRAGLVRTAAVAGGATMVVVLAAVGALAAARQSGEPQGFVIPEPDPTTTVAATTTAAPTTTVPVPTVAPTAVAPGATTLPATTAAPTTPPTTPPPPPYAGVVAIGDSVMLGAKGALERRMPGIAIDASVSRQVKGGAELAEALQSQGRLGRAVIVHLGTNGVTTQSHYDRLMTALAGVPRVVMINTKVPRPWEERVNGLIATTAQRYPNIVFVDWKAQGSAHKEWFWNDGIHLRPEGAAAFAELIAQAVGKTA